MLVHPQFDPIALQLGPVAIHWYGLMYLVAFAQVILLGRWCIAHRPWSGWDAKMLDDVLFYGVLGVILGGRLGYVLFYKPMEYLAHPLDIFKVWEGGMSFHGGFLGVIIAMAVFAHRHKLRWLAVTDFIAPLVPLGLAAGRLGNFINGELWGRATDLPWGMVFQQAGDGIARHPSQLYQFAGEGLLLFVILWLVLPASRARSAPSPACSSSATAASASSPNSPASPTAFSACWDWAFHGAMAVAADGHRRRPDAALGATSIQSGQT